METKDLHIDKSNNLHIDKSNDLHIIAVTGPDINNGPGFRVTIWVSGCTHACPGCQNKHTWKYGQGHKLDDMVPYHITCKEKILIASRKLILKVNWLSSVMLDASLMLKCQVQQLTI